MGVVAAAEFGATEELPARGIDEVLGRLAGGLFGRGPQLARHSANARFAAFPGRWSSRIAGV